MRVEFTEAVEIELGKIGLYRVITDVEQAAEALLYRWPLQDGPALVEAKRACLAAMEGQLDPNIARTAFLVAANEADLSVRLAQRYIPEGKSVEQRWARKRLRAHQ